MDYLENSAYVNFMRSLQRSGQERKRKALDGLQKSNDLNLNERNDLCR